MDVRKKKVMVVLGLACPIFLWRAYVLITEYLPAQAEAAPPALVTFDEGLASQQQNNASAQDMTGLLEKQDAIVHQPWGRDPFESVVKIEKHHESVEPEEPEIVRNEGPPPGSPSLTLTGVSKAGEQWLASARGRILRIGDVVDEKYKVVEITTRALILESEGWAFRYEMGNSDAAVYRRSEAP